MIIYEEIFKAFQKHKVEYIIVGGLAFNLLGGSRNTTDLDIIARLSDSNLKKIVSILKKQGYRVKIPVDPMGIADEKTRKDWIKNKHLRAINFYKISGSGEVDLLIDTPVTYQQAKKNKEIIRIEPLSLPIVSIDDLIKMKRAAGRPIDKLDVSALQEIKKYRRNSNV